MLVCLLLIFCSIWFAFDSCDSLGRWLLWLELTVIGCRKFCQCVKNSGFSWQKRPGTHTNTHARTHTHLTALCPEVPAWASTGKVKPIGILLKQETVSGSDIIWAIYASLHLTPDRWPRQHPTTQFFTGCMPFLPPNRQRQSTEGNKKRPFKSRFSGRTSFVFISWQNHCENNFCNWKPKSVVLECDCCYGTTLSI